MKLLGWIRQEVADQGAVVAQGRASRDEALTVLTDRVIEKDPSFVWDLTAECVGKALDAFLSKHVQEDGEQDALPGLFPELPALIEVSPGRFVAQGAMTRRDWQAARVQARTKADNASRHADKIDRRADELEPLLTDDELTTAQVLGQAA